MIQRGDIINGTYRIEDIIGAGGGGTVFKAYHLRLEKYVVVKRINDAWVDIMDSRKEADIIKNLKHQYLPQAYDFIKVEDGIYTVMDFVPGASLDKYIKSGFKFRQQQVLYWAKQVTEALVYLHSQKPPIIHSDIKPANIMINLDGDVCLIDFNVSLTSTPDSSISATSRGYAAPEQYLNIKPLNTPVQGQPFVPKYNFDMTSPLDQRSDIYSLGATLYHLMTGQRPPKLPENKLPEIPAQLEGFDEPLINIVNKMIKYDPRERYQTAGELLNDLNNIRRLDRRYKKHKRSRLIVNTVFPIVMVGAVVLGVAGYMMMKRETETDYNDKLSYADRLLENKDYEKAEKAYSELIEKSPERIEPYYGMLKMYTDRYDYEGAAKYGEDMLAEHSFENSSSDPSALSVYYYLLANSYFEMENYEKANGYYAKAIDADDSNKDLYCDYAVSLARSGYTDKAEELLKGAEGKGLENDKLRLVSAEIAFAKGDMKAAEEQFAQLAAQAADNDLAQRACIYLCRVYQREGKYDELISAAEKYKSILNAPRKRAAEVMCAEAYLSKAGVADGEEKKLCAQKAVDIYNELKKSGAVSKKSDFNLATAYEYLDDMVGAQTILNDMMVEFPDDPDVYARLAILEADKQAKRSLSKRNYESFKKYYDKAEKLDRQNKVNGTSSSYIATMETLYERIKENDWIKE